MYELNKSESKQSISPMYFPGGLRSDSGLGVFNPEQMMVEKVFDYYHKCLPRKEKVINVMKHLGIYSPDVIDTFGLGFSDKTLGGSFRSSNSSENDSKRGMGQRLGLFKPNGHEYFPGALIFPFYDQCGQVRGAYGKKVFRQKKRPNQSCHHQFWNREEVTFFNIKAVSEYEHLVLCESPVDALVLWCAGIKNVVALMDCGHFSKRHLDLLEAVGTRHVDIAFSDRALSQSCARNINKTFKKLNINSQLVSANCDVDLFDLLSRSYQGVH